MSAAHDMQGAVQTAAAATEAAGAAPAAVQAQGVTPSPAGRPTPDELWERKLRTRRHLEPGYDEVMTISMGPQHPSTHGVLPG